MASRSKSRRVKPKTDPVVKLARLILPERQATNGDLAIRDVANHSDADQRASVRSGETKTVRRKTRVELLQLAGIITREQQAACEWYLTAFELGYQTVGCTGNYTGAGGGGFGSTDLFARYKAQREARENFQYAKQAIPQHLRANFDRVVIGPMDIRTITNEDRLRFSLAAFLLLGQIGHMLAVAA